jgi:TolB protein
MVMSLCAAATVAVTLSGCGGESPSDASADGTGERRIASDFAVSPDGNSVAFSRIAGDGTELQEGDIYVSRRGGRTHRITVGADDDRGPAWSPDGSKLVFTRDADGEGEVYVVKAGGSTQKRLTGIDGYHHRDYPPAWSPDGSRIVFARAFPADIRVLYVMSADGTGLTKLTTLERHHAGATWSPDGKSIAYDGTTEDGGFITSVWLQRMDAEQSDGARQLRVGAFPAWSPDGSRIAFSAYSGNGEIVVMDAKSGRSRALRVDRWADHPLWSPDGTQIAFTGLPKGRALDCDACEEIYAVNVDGSGLRRLARNAAEENLVSWTPDGRIAFERGGALYLMHADGSGVRRWVSRSSP